MKHQTIAITGLIILTIGLFSFAFEKGAENNKRIAQERKIERERQIREQYIQDSIRQDSIARVESYKDSIKIVKVLTSSPNSAGGVDAEVVWKNNTKRTIKYMVFVLNAYNAVGDIVPCDIRDYRTARLEVTGPIKTGKTHGYGTYWDCVWYNHSIKKAKVYKYEITFMDNETIDVYL